MPSLLPAFEDPRVQFFCVCVWFPVSESPLSLLALETSGKKLGWTETRYESSQGPAWIRIRVDRTDSVDESCRQSPRQGHFHLECQLESAFSVSRAKIVPRNELEEVERLLRILSEERNGDVCFRGGFRIPMEELPKRGTASLMLELAVRVGAAELGVTGVTFNVRKRPPFDELAWNVKREKDKTSSLRVTLDASDRLENVGSDLNELVRVLSKGVEELVLDETSDLEGAST